MLDRRNTWLIDMPICVTSGQRKLQRVLILGQIFIRPLNSQFTKHALGIGKMSPKIFTLLFVCLVLAAVEATYLDEKSRDDSGTDLEKCDPRFCRGEEQCHQCCHHNYHIDNKLAGDNEEDQRTAIDSMCECYHAVNGRAHEE